jgi:DNA-binding transcriptional ArsR family regulator
MMNDFVKLSQLFQALGDVNRLRIIRAMGGTRRSVTELVEATGLSQPLVSHHLRALRESGIFEAERSGPFVYYSLKDARLLDTLGLMLEISHDTKPLKSYKPAFCYPPWWRDGGGR